MANNTMKQWDKDTVINWVNNLPSDEYNKDNKDQIISGINKFSATGDDIWDASKQDLIDGLGLGSMLAKKLAKTIAAQRKKDLGDNIPGNPTDDPVNNINDVPFELNIGGSKPTRLKNIKSSMTISKIKELYLKEFTNNITTAKMQGVSIKYLGSSLSNSNATLKEYGILNGNGMQLFVTYSLNGGMSDDIKNNDDDDDDDDEFRFRTLQYKKYPTIKLSSKPDMIYGSTDYKRALMPCGCAISADTLYNYMKSVFDKDLRALKYLICPQLRNKCLGSDTQRQWNWQLVFIIADLSVKEISQYSLMIQNRISGTKECPNCHALCERPSNVKIWRVRCTNCNQKDWCYQCGEFWKGSGLTICGNGNCIAYNLNQCLKNTNWIEPQYSSTGWTKGISVPEMRACPECLTLIEYGKNCQHMTCVVCPHQFCFKCLAPYSKTTYYSCIPDQCEIAPIQTF